MNAGEHSMEIYQKDGDEKFQLLNKTFKFKEKEPLIKNDAVVLGMLLLLLALIFKTEASNIPFFKKFYGIVPALLLCYFLPAFLNTFGIISSDESNLYFVASRYLLPASLKLKHRPWSMGNRLFAYGSSTVTYGSFAWANIVFISFNFFVRYIINTT